MGKTDSKVATLVHSRAMEKEVGMGVSKVATLVNSRAMVQKVGKADHRGKMNQCSTKCNKIVVDSSAFVFHLFRRFSSTVQIF